jgi:membrane protease YdiL (CAAX protease family)
LISASIGVMALRGWYHPALTVSASAVVSFVYFLAVFVCVGITEEVLFRGFVFRLIENKRGPVVALIVSALIFGLGHFLNPGATLWSGLAIALHAGLTFGVLFVITRSLWAPIGAHVAWNLFEGPVWGTEVSGLDARGLVHATLDGPAGWTGGRFGPEAGGVVVLLSLVVIAVLFVIAIRRRSFADTRSQLGRSGGSVGPLQDASDEGRGGRG